MPLNRLLTAAAAIALIGAAAPANAQTPSAQTPAAAPLAKPVVANGDLLDTLKLNGQFTTFTGGVDATNLGGLLKANKNLTVFAPTDAAFAAMPAADLAALKANKTAMQKFILHHIVNAPIPSTKIKGAKGLLDTGAQDKMLIDGSDPGGALKVDGGTIVQADLQTGSGLLQVVDHVLIAGQGDMTMPAPAEAAAPAAAAPAAVAPAAGTKPK
jgi:uncharacterized surface protein with fasciclin (FAS1) repeats